MSKLKQFVSKIKKIKNIKYSTKIQHTNNQSNDNNKSSLNVVKNDIGLAKFLGRSYKYTGLSIASSLGVAYTLPIFVDLSIAYEHPVMYGISCLGVGLSGIFFMDRTKYIVVEEQIDNTTEKALVMKNSTERHLAYATFLTGITLSLVPFVHLVNTVAPSIIPIASGLSLATMGAASLFAYMRPKGSLLKYGGTLAVAMVGLIGVQLAGLGASWLGHSSLAHSLHSINIYVGILIMTANTAYTTHCAIDMYENKEPDHLMVSTNLYLEFVNLMIRFANILLNKDFPTINGDSDDE